MKQILLTGFEPFDGQSINPSWQTVQAASCPPGAAMQRLLLPVSFRQSTAAVLEMMQTQQFDLILCLGQAGGRNAITPERLGINLDDASIPDNTGYQPCEAPIIPDGPDAIFSSLPVRALSQALQSAGVRSQVSNSAGTFVCNHLLYSLLWHCKKSCPETHVGFLHLPWLTEQTQTGPSMPLEEMVRGVDAALTFLVSIVGK